MESIEIVKKNGETEVFDPSKLRASLERAETPPSEVEKIVDLITAELEPGDTTTEIYRHAFELLKKRKNAYAARYSMKESVADLGPTGYPFESFLAEVLSQKGFNTETDVYIKGACTSHELDVMAENDDTVIFIEAKFHNQSGPKSGLQTALYVKARFEDLRDNGYGRDMKGKTAEHWLVTNTKFTTHAREYGECKGLTMVGWEESNHAEVENLQQMIENSALQPITALTTLSTSNKRDLTKDGVVLCRDIHTDGDHHEKLQGIGLGDEQIADVVDVVTHLCKV